MVDFRNKEIKGLKKLRFFAIMFLVVVNVAILSFFLIAFYSVYKERNLTENFALYVLQTIAGIQMVLSVFFLPLYIILFKRFSWAIKEIKDLNSEYIALYKNYTTSVDRPFPNIPEFIISQKGLVIIKNFKCIILTEQNLSRISIKRIRLGVRMRKCIVKFYDHDDLLTTTIVYYSLHPKKVEFLKNNIHLVHEYVIIED